MKDLSVLMKRRIKELTAEKKRLQKVANIAIEGNIQVSRCKNGVFYYHTYVDEAGTFHREYLSKKKMDQIQALAKKRYGKERLSEIDRELDAWKTFKQKLGNTGKRQAKRMLEGNDELTELLLPLANPMLQKAWQWASTAKPSDYREEEKIHSSKNGLKVRSKAEAMIASALEEQCVPFRYEEPLRIGTRRVVPDFTIMSPVTGELYYWEHFGMMDNEDYCSDAVDKLMLYQRQGILLGQQLMITLETSYQPLGYREIQKVVDKLKLDYC